MSGAWVTWPADVFTWPGVTDITPQLDQAIAALRWHRDIADATYEYTPGASIVTFHLLVRGASPRSPPRATAAQRYTNASHPPASASTDARTVATSWPPSGSPGGQQKGTPWAPPFERGYGW